MHMHEECGGAERPREQQACISHSILLLPGRLPSDWAAGQVAVSAVDFLFFFVANAHTWICPVYMSVRWKYAVRSRAGIPAKASDSTPGPLYPPVTWPPQPGVAWPRGPLSAGLSVTMMVVMMLITMGVTALRINLALSVMHVFIFFALPTTNWERLWLCPFDRVENQGTEGQNKVTKLVSARDWIWTQIQAAPKSIPYPNHLALLPLSHFFPYHGATCSHILWGQPALWREKDEYLILGSLAWSLFILFIFGCAGSLLLPVSFL